MGKPWAVISAIVYNIFVVAMGEAGVRQSIWLTPTFSMSIERRFSPSRKTAPLPLSMSWSRGICAPACTSSDLPMSSERRSTLAVTRSTWRTGWAVLSRSNLR
eukprot:595830-Pyramimonas_sp.AAC.1